MTTPAKIDWLHSELDATAWSHKVHVKDELRGALAPMRGHPYAGYSMTNLGTWTTTPVKQVWSLEWVTPDFRRLTWYFILTNSGSYYAVLGGAFDDADRAKYGKKIVWQPFTGFRMTVHGKSIEETRTGTMDELYAAAAALTRRINQSDTVQIYWLDKRIGELRGQC